MVESRVVGAQGLRGGGVRGYWDVGGRVLGVVGIKMVGLKLWSKGVVGSRDGGG